MSKKIILTQKQASILFDCINEVNSADQRYQDAASYKAAVDRQFGRVLELLGTTSDKFLSLDYTTCTLTLSDEGESELVFSEEVPEFIENHE